MPTEFRSYTTVEVARRLGVSLQTVQRWVDSGRLKAWKTLGGHRRIEAESAEALFRTQAATAGASPSKPVDTPMGRRVLIVDDNPLDLELLSLLVRQLLPDASLETAPDGFQALLSMGAAPPDVLITDIAMPHMDGFEMLRSLSELRASKPSTIVAVSSLSPTELDARGRLLPDIHFLSKPVDRHRLAQVLAA